MMKTQEVANRLVELCRQGKYEEAQSELYAANVVSLEPAGAALPRAEGLEALQQKGEHWASMVEEMHSAEVSDPIVAGNFFTLKMVNDVTFKEMGRQTIEELAVYEVRDGKVVLEQFFYPVQPQ